MKVAVFGLGYVGTVTAAVLASHGHEVRAVDVDPAKVAILGGGRSPVVEPALNGLVTAGASTGALRATRDACEALAHAELSLVCVGTPSSPQGDTDLRLLVRAVGEIASALEKAEAPASGHHALVVRSAVPPGTLEDVVAAALTEHLVRVPFEVGTGVCPEFLREGTAISDFYKAPFTVVGTTDTRVGDTMRELLGFLSGPVTVVKPRVAEALKYALKAFHATKVSFAYELGQLFHYFGVDAREVMDLFSEDPKLSLSSKYLEPGFEFGGSCPPKDLRSLLNLARMSCLDLPLLAGAMATNARSLCDVVNRVVASEARSIALLGLSFKINSDDLRESLYVDMAETLIDKGFDIRIYDPIMDPVTLVSTNRHHVDPRSSHLRRLFTTSPSEALANVDLAIVSSSHPSVIAGLVVDPPRAIIDMSGRLGHAVEALPGYEGAAW
jgi:GDP-mannose 6-dehydrogenase